MQIKSAAKKHLQRYFHFIRWKTCTYIIWRNFIRTLIVGICLFHTLKLCSVEQKLFEWVVKNFGNVSIQARVWIWAMQYMTLSMIIVPNVNVAGSDLFGYNSITLFSIRTYCFRNLLTFTYKFTSADYDSLFFSRKLIKS